MLDNQYISEKKQALIDKYLSEPVKAGDIVMVKGLGSKDKEAWNNFSKVESVDGTDVYIKEHDYSVPTKISLPNYRKATYTIGKDPFAKIKDNVISCNYILESIIGIVTRQEKYSVLGMEVIACDFNPYIYDEKGKKQFYQRALVWSEDDKRLLIDSIYNGVSCGKILMRNRGFEELEEMAKNGEKQLAWKDCVDGKQRLNAVLSFIRNEFKDSEGNYYADLSKSAQYKFGRHQLFSYCEMPENTLDQDVIEQFLKLNFSGVQQSKEHLDFVKKLHVKN